MNVCKEIIVTCGYIFLYFCSDKWCFFIRGGFLRDCVLCMGKVKNSESALKNPLDPTTPGKKRGRPKKSTTTTTTPAKGGVKKTTIPKASKKGASGQKSTSKKKGIQTTTKKKQATVKQTGRKITITMEI